MCVFFAAFYEKIIIGLLKKRCIKTLTCQKKVEKCKAIKRNLEFKSLFLYTLFCVQYISFFLITDFTVGWTYVVFFNGWINCWSGVNSTHVHVNYDDHDCVQRHSKNTQCLTAFMYLQVKCCWLQIVFCLKLLYMY